MIWDDKPTDRKGRSTCHRDGVVISNLVVERSSASLGHSALHAAAYPFGVCERPKNQDCLRK